MRERKRERVNGNYAIKGDWLTLGPGAELCPKVFANGEGIKVTDCLEDFGMLNNVNRLVKCQ